MTESLSGLMKQQNRYSRPALGPAKTVEHVFTIHEFVGRTHLVRPIYMYVYLLLVFVLIL